MTEAETTVLPLRPHGHDGSAAIDSLANAVTTEVRLLEDLIGIMRRQRSAVAADDLQGVDDSVFATHRVLVTLGEARRRRRSLNRLVGGAEDLPLKGLEGVLGARMTDELRFARDGLHAAALILSQEVEMNRQVLREALAAGNDYVRTIYGAPQSRALYASEPQPVETARRGGLLVNRQA